MEEVTEVKDGQPVVALPETPELTEEQLAERTANRKVFKDLHDYFAEVDIYAVEGSMGMLQGMADAAFQKLQDKITLAELEIETDDEHLKKVIELLGKYTCSEAVSYCQALKNALDYHKFLKTKELKLKDLEVKLLD